MPKWGCWIIASSSSSSFSKRNLHAISLNGPYKYSYILTRTGEGVEHPLPHLLFVVCFKQPSLTGVRWSLMVVFWFAFAWWIMTLSICSYILAICMFALEKYLFWSFAKIGLFFLLWGFQVPYIWILAPYQMYDSQIFSPILPGCCFTLLYVPFMQKVFSWIHSTKN